MIQPLHIANYFIQNHLNGGNLTPLKLVKLTYISHGWHLGIADVPFFEENIQAWQYGPVIKSVYHTFKHHGKNPVDNPFLMMSSPNYTDFQTKLLNKIWEVYGGYDGLALSTKTHQPGTPWYTAWHELGGKQQHGIIIPNDIIKKHYKKRIEEEKKTATT